MAIEFSTRDYEWSHGTQPRGRGNWWFFFDGYEFNTYGTYSEAKRLCKEFVKSLAPTDYVGHVTVKVGA